MALHVFFSPHLEGSGKGIHCHLFCLLFWLKSGTWKGISIPHMAMSHTHYLFADDTLLFGKATMGEAQVINRIIMDYSLFSG